MLMPLIFLLPLLLLTTLLLRCPTAANIPAIAASVPADVAAHDVFIAFDVTYDA
jgi:hypothetical protein